MSIYSKSFILQKPKTFLVPLDLKENENMNLLVVLICGPFLLRGPGEN
jgi:hypothetical protein